MTGSNRIALDTTIAIKILNDGAFAAMVSAKYDQIYISAVAAGELLYGARNSARHVANLQRFQSFIDDCLFIPVTREIAEQYAKLRHGLKTKGFPIPDSDIWIAAASIHLSLPLATSDRHFSFVDDLVTVALTL